MNYISASDLNTMINENQDFQLIDVRESYEYEDGNIGGLNIPLGDMIERKSEISITKQVILCCKSGKRSAAMAISLERKFDIQGLNTLKGGLENYFELYA